MKTIRQGIFETNSSSTHALVILSKEEYEKWQKDEVVLDLYKGVTRELDPNRKIIRQEDNSILFNGRHYDGMYDLLEAEYDDIDDSYAIKEYVDMYAEVIKEELDDKVIMSVYRGERW